VAKGAEMAGHILRRLRCPASLIQRVEALVANHLRFKDVRRMKDSTLKRFLRMDGFEEHLELHRLDCLSSHGNLEDYEFARSKLAELPRETLRPPRLLTGRDLIRAGYTPGPQFSRLLEAVEDAQLEGRVQTPEEALHLVRSLYRSPPEKP
jgi:poly(A) polymerase